MAETALPALSPQLRALSVMLRGRTPGDADFLRDVYVSARWEEVAATGWPEPLRLAFLHDQYRLQHAHYSKFYEGAAWGVIEVNGERAGRLYLLHRGSDLRIIDIALMPAYRNRGIGGALLTAVQQMVRAVGAAKASIHVEMNNPALRLYQRLGFRMSGDSGVYYLLEWDAASAENSLISEVAAGQTAHRDQK